jgi:hypothetical protein
MTSARPRGFAIVAAGLGVFLVCFLLFALQARSAHRQALAAVPDAAAPQRVLQRRVVVRTIVVHLRPAGEEGSRAIPVRVTVPATPAPVSTTHVAPAPAAAPAPLVTRTS